MTYINRAYSKSPFQLIEVGVTEATDMVNKVESKEVSSDISWLTDYSNSVTSANQKYYVTKRYNADPINNLILDTIVNNSGVKSYFNGSETYVKTNGSIFVTSTGDSGVTQSNIASISVHSAVSTDINYNKRVYVLMRVN